MEEVSQQIKELHEQMIQRFEHMERRMDKMDGRLDAMDGRLHSMDSRLDSLEEASQVTRDIIKDMELRFDERFSQLDAKVDALGAGQNEIRRDIARLERGLFLGEDSREHADAVQLEEFRKLEKRVSALESHRTLAAPAA